MTKANEKTPKAPKANKTAKTDEKKARLPLAKRIGVQIARLTARITKVSLKLAKYGDATQPIRVVIVEATQKLDAARASLDALPDNALARKSASSKKAVAVGSKVTLTDKARESFKDVLTADEAKATFEVVAMMGSTVRVKSASGNVLFLKRGKLALAEAPAPAAA